MEGKDKNSNVWKEKIRMIMFGNIRQKFQRLKGWDKNSNVWKHKRRLLVFGSMG